MSEKSKIIARLEKAHGKNWRRKVNLRELRRIFPPELEQKLENNLVSFTLNFNNQKLTKLRGVLKEVRTLDDNATTIDRNRLLKKIDKIYASQEVQTAGKNTEFIKGIQERGVQLEDAMQKHNEKIFKTALKLPINLDTDPTYSKVKFFASRSAELITKTNTEERALISKTIQDGFIGGFNKNKMVKELDRTLNGDAEVKPFSQTKIERIARDQMLKLQANIQKEQMAQAGVEKYIWRTVGDGAVRPTHEERDGKVYEFGKESLEPGDDINCRCYAEPVIE